MDLSQQELPLTAYFTRGRKVARDHAVPYRTDERTADSQCVARASKRRKSSTSPLGSSTRKSRSRVTTLQQPTPATSTRKRVRNVRLELSAKVPLTPTSTLLSSVERNASSPSGNGPSELSGVPLTTPISDRRRTSKSVNKELLADSRHSGHGKTGIPTPQTSSRRISQPQHDNYDHSPFASSSHHLPSKPSQASSGLLDSGALPPQHTARSTEGLPCSPVGSDRSDPFYAHEKNNVTVQRHATYTQYSLQSKALDVQSSAERAVRMLTVSSSQSQYLLHPDATPKRNRYSRRVERVISSQTQEEQELTLSTPHRLTRISGRISPGKYPIGLTQISRLGHSERESPRVRTPNSKPVGSPINSPTGRSRSSLATKKALDELSPKSSGLSRHKRTASCPSPSPKTKTLRRSLRRNSIENIISAHVDDSLTESESESDILQMMGMHGKLCALGLPSPEVNPDSPHPSLARDVPPLDCFGPAECNLPGVGDDSATEAESDTEILHCVAEIGKKRPRDRRSEPPTPSRLIISPLVSPARSRIATAPLIISSTQSPIQEDSVASGSCASYPSSVERRRLLSGSLPSVVRDFIHMFPGDGDESYPADFPESLRV